VRGELGSDRDLHDLDLAGRQRSAVLPIDDTEGALQRSPSATGLALGVGLECFVECEAELCPHGCELLAEGLHRLFGADSACCLAVGAPRAVGRTLLRLAGAADGNLGIDCVGRVVGDARAHLAHCLSLGIGTTFTQFRECKIHYSIT